MEALCRMHYDWRRHEEKTGKLRKPRRSWPDTVCRREGCKGEPKKLGMCLKHYNAVGYLKRSGQTELKPRVRRKWTNTECDAEGCESAAAIAYKGSSVGYCRLHYQRLTWAGIFEKDPE